MSSEHRQAESKPDSHTSERPRTPVRVQSLATNRFEPGTHTNLSGEVSLEGLADKVEVISVLVDMLYIRLLASPELKMFFADVDLQRLRLHQSHFFNQLFSGAALGKFHTLRAIHKRLVDKLGLGEQDFDTFVVIAVGVLRDVSLPDALIEEFKLRIDMLREWVLDMPSTHTPTAQEKFLADLRES